MLANNGEERVAVKKSKTNKIVQQAYPILEYDENRNSITKVKTDIYPKNSKIK